MNQDVNHDPAVSTEATEPKKSKSRRRWWVTGFSVPFAFSVFHYWSYKQAKAEFLKEEAARMAKAGFEGEIMHMCGFHPFSDFAEGMVLFFVYPIFCITGVLVGLFACFVYRVVKDVIQRERLLEKQQAEAKA